MSKTRPSVGQLGSGQTLEDVVAQLEVDLRFLLDEGSGEESAKGRHARPKRQKLCQQMMKVNFCLKDDANVFDKSSRMTVQTLGLADEHEWQEFVDEMSRSTRSSLLKDVTLFIEKKVNESSCKRSFLMDPAAARRHFHSYRDVVPLARIDLWTMLTRALIEYERILKGKCLSGAAAADFRAQSW